MGEWKEVFFQTFLPPCYTSVVGSHSSRLIAGENISGGHSIGGWVRPRIEVGVLVCRKYPVLEFESRSSVLA